VFILLIFKELPIELRPGAAAQLAILLKLQVDAHYPSYPAACDPAYPVTFLPSRFLHQRDIYIYVQMFVNSVTGS